MTLNQKATRQRISWAALAGLALAMVWPVLLPIQAAETVVLSGRVYNAATGSGYGGVTIALCNLGSATTAANGNWQVAVPHNAYYCVRVVAGAPAGVTGPGVRNNPDITGATSYEHQVAGVNCYHMSGCSTDLQRWDRAVDGGLDFVYTPSAPTAAPVAPPAVTPPPAPATAPVATASVPADFVAEAGTGDAAVITLRWKPSEPAGAISYRLERSLDRTTWTTLVEKMTEATYIDRDVAGDVHYYYRLNATGSDSKASDWIMANATTGRVLASQDQRDQTFSTPDKLASVKIPEGAMPADTTCNITNTQDKLGSKEHPLMAGPYQLECRDNTGKIITEFGQNVTWRLNVSKTMTGQKPPLAVRLGNNGKTETITDATYNDTEHIVSMTTSAVGPVAVLVRPVDWSWLNLAIPIGAGAILMMVLLLLPIHARRKVSYQEYLRAKYYNL